MNILPDLRSDDHELEQAEDLGVRPRSVDYNENTDCDDVVIKIRPKRTKTTPPADGPTASRVQAQSSSTGTPGVRLPAVKATRTKDEPDEEETPVTDDVVPSKSSKLDVHQPNRKDSFNTKSFVLKKTKQRRKYDCKLCTEV